MTKLVTIFVLSFLLSGCQRPADKSSASIGDSSYTPIEIPDGGNSNPDNFLLKFTETSADSFTVFSSDLLEPDTYKFKGVRLEDSDIAFLPASIVNRYKYDRDFYACFRLEMDSTHSGLIIRTPSTYVASSIKLFVFDHREQKIIDPVIELAESFGDAGFSMTKKTWIVKNTSGSPSFLIWQRDVEDKSVEDENDTTVLTADHAYLLKFRTNRFDTLNKSTEDLLKTFRGLLSKKNSE